MKHKFIFSVAFVFFINALFAQHTNIKISNYNYPEEPGIMINPKDPKYIVGGANINNYYYSSDTGKTWSRGTLSSSYGVWGDPCIIVDTTGAFYFFHLSNPSNGNWIDRIVCQKTTNNGLTWNNGSYTGLNGTKAQDKQWGIVDRKRNIIYITWTQFDSYGSYNTNDSSHILFSKSLDGGATWSTPKRLDAKGGDCIDSDNTVEGAVPAVGPKGELYVAYAGPQGLYFTTSKDGGTTWKKPKVVSDMPGGWDYVIPGLDRCNGLPITVCDVSRSQYKGNIYINWTDQRNGTNNTDVWFIKSTDGGKTFSQPIRVNDDNSGHHQFLTWMDVDQANGNIYFVFYDRRNYMDNKTDVYMARSTDGGQTFINFKISETPFTPTESVFFGDYTNLSVYNDIARPIWTRLDNFSTSIYTALVNTSIIGNTDNIAQQAVTNAAVVNADNDITHYPNPVSSTEYVAFKMHATGKVSIQIFDNAGKLIAAPVNKTYDYGKYIEPISFAALNIAPGIYYLHINIAGEKEVRKVSYMK